MVLMSTMARSTNWVKNTALVAVFTQTASIMKESGKMTNRMVLEVVFTQVVANTLDFS